MAVDIDRTRAQYVGITTRDVIPHSLVVNLAGSGKIAPTYWLNPANGVTYNIVAADHRSIGSNFAVSTVQPADRRSAATSTQVLGGIADLRRDTASAVVSQYDLQGLVQVYAAVQGRDPSARSAADVRRMQSTSWRPALRPRSAPSSCRAKSGPWKAPSPACCSAFLAPSVLIYLLIVVNFQSWSDPFVIIIHPAPAGRLGRPSSGCCSLPTPTLLGAALTGAIMCMGVATANSVLVVSFARERLAELGDATCGGTRRGLRALPSARC